MRLLKGADVSAGIREQVRKDLEEMEGPLPKLAIVRAGERPDDVSYERGAMKKLAAFGLRAQSFPFPEDISDEDFKKEFCAVNADADVDGILLLRPLPRQIRERDIAQMIDPAKDLDGISLTNMARVYMGDAEGFAPCTAEAAVEILKAGGVPIAGKRVTIVGRSLVVGRPLAMLRMKENATVTVCHTGTVDLKGACRQAEILVAAAGRAKMITGDYIRPGAVVLDVGIHVGADGRMCGDADLASMEGKAAAATPVPGGIGAVTTAVLARHLVRAARSRRTGSGPLPGGRP